jgi:hypothetical protein
MFSIQRLAYVPMTPKTQYVENLEGVMVLQNAP